MSDIETIQSLYSQRTEQALRLWHENPGIGSLKAPKFHPTKLALTTGGFVVSEIGDVTQHLRTLAEGDDLADVTNREAFHFSFLSISLPLFDSLAQITGLDELKACFDSCCAGRTFTIKNLRLVALPDSLLIAGVPDELSATRRSHFAEQLLHTAWRGKLAERYRGGSIPPVYWHSTLIRYNAEFLPERFRDYFEANQARGFGEITLPLRLLAANFSWKNSLILG